MKIGLFTDTYVPDVNGVVTVIKAMIRELRKEGHEVYVFCPSHPHAGNSEPGVYRFHSVKFLPYKGLRVAIPYSRSALRVIPKLDIIHSNGPGSIGLMAVWASKRYHIPHVHTYHTLFMDYRRYLPRVIRPSRDMIKRASRLLCNSCDAIIAPSDQMKKELESYGVIRPIYSLPFGVDEEEFSHEIQWDVKKELNIQTKDLLLYVGRLGLEKNIDFLLRSFKRLLAMRPEAVLIIAGDGPNREFLQKYVVELGVEASVRFIGYLKRSDLVDLYRQALFVFASKSETQGLVIMEAMMAGAAVVAIGIMGPKDIIKSGETGILVDEDENEFAQAVARLLQDDNERQRLGRAAHEWARTQTSQMSTHRLLEIYALCISARQAKSVATQG